MTPFIPLSFFLKIETNNKNYKNIPPVFHFPLTKHYVKQFQGRHYLSTNNDLFNIKHVKKKYIVNYKNVPVNYKVRGLPSFCSTNMNAIIYVARAEIFVLQAKRTKLCSNTGVQNMWGSQSACLVKDRMNIPLVMLVKQGRRNVFIFFIFSFAQLDS